MTQAIFWTTLFTGFFWIVGQEQIYFFMGASIIVCIVVAITHKFLT